MIFCDGCKYISVIPNKDIPNSYDGDIRTKSYYCEKMKKYMTTTNFKDRSLDKLKMPVPDICPLEGCEEKKEESKEIKYCKDCKYYSCERIVGCPVANYCHNSLLDIVSNSDITIGFCYDQRIVGLCGHDAKYFEKKGDKSNVNDMEKVGE